MTDTTQTYWDVDGTSLQTYAFNITTLGGDREAPPPVRGRNVQVPYMPGSLWTPKVEDERVITLGMWVVGANEDGSIPTTEDGRRTYDRNWRMLRNLLYRPRRQFTLTKRFWVETADLTAAGVDVGALTTIGDWTLYTASAKASYAGGLTPTRTGATRAIFTVDLLLSDPLFYSEELEIEFSTSAVEPDPGPTQTVTILGDARTHQIEVDFEGPLTSPQIQNNSATGEEGQAIDLWVRYGNAIADGESATVRVKPFSATHYPAGTPFKSSGYVQHDGDRFWLWLEPGSTTLALTAQEGTGTAVLRYQPGWY